jgi:archaellum component FlaC
MASARDILAKRDKPRVSALDILNKREQRPVPSLEQLQTDIQSQLRFQDAPDDIAGRARETEGTRVFGDRPADEQARLRTAFKFLSPEAREQIGLGDVRPPSDIAASRDVFREAGDIAGRTTEDVNAEIDRLFGVEPDPFRGDRPLTEDEKRFKDIGKVGRGIHPAIGPILQALSVAGRTGTRAGTGVAGFTAGSPRFAALEPGEAGEEVQGLREMFGTVLPTLQHRTQRAFQIPQSVIGEVDPSAPLSKLQEAITGRPFTQEEFEKAVSTGVSEAPESPVFGATLGRGAVKGGGKSARAVLKRIDRDAKAPILRKTRTKPVETAPVEPSGAKSVELPSFEGPLEPAPKVGEPVVKPAQTKPTTLPPEPVVAPKPRPPAKTVEVPVKTTEAAPAIPGKVSPPPKPTTHTPKGTPATKAVGLNKAENAAIREQFKLESLPEAEVRKFTSSVSDAKARGLDKTALETADEVLKNNRPISDAEHAGMTLKATELIKDLETQMVEAAGFIEKGDVGSANMARGQIEALELQLDKLTEATRLGRRETARAMSIGRIRVDTETLDLVPTLQRARVAKGGKLTPKETAKIKTVVEANKKLEARLKTLEKEFDVTRTERDRLAAERATAKEAAASKIVSKARKKQVKIEADRASIKKQLEAIGLRVNDITGLGVEGSFLVGKLATTYIREGITTLDAVVKAVRKDVPDLTARDVYQALADRSPRKQRQARNDIRRRIGQMKTQSRLLLAIERAEKGIFDQPKGAKRQPAPKAIRALQRQLRDLRQEAFKSNLEASRLESAIQKINEAQDQLENQYRRVKKKQPVDAPELAEAKKKLGEIRKLMRTKDELARLNEQLRTGEFEVRQRVAEENVPEALDRARVDVQIARKRVRAAVQDLAPLTGKKLFGEVANFNRSTLATADMSGLFRQNIIPALSHPFKTIKTLPKTLRATFSDFNAERIDLQMRSRPQAYLYEKSKLEIRELDGTITKREESFMSKLAEKIPIFGRVVRASNRNMTTMGNLIRTSLFDDFLLKNPNATQTELTAYAKALNVFTGIGDLGQFAGAANALSFGFFAPKLAVSRVQAPYQVVKNWKNPRVRKQVVRDMGGFVATGLTILNLAKLWESDDNDIEVGTDPRESDWGKIRVGNTRIDIWGGFQQPARLIARTGLGITDKIGATGTHLTKSQREFDWVEELTRFAQYKQAPFIGLTRELIRGKSAVGESRTIPESFARSVVPLILQDIEDAWKDAGFGRAAAVGALAFTGVGVNTFTDSESRLKRDIKKLRAEGNITAATKKQRELTILRLQNKKRRARKK